MSKGFSIRHHIMKDAGYLKTIRFRRHWLRLPAAFLTGAMLVLSACDQEPPKPIERIRAIKTFTVTDVASGQIRKYSGIVQATNSSSLSFQVSGNVQKVSVKLGNRVTKGQVLAVLDKKPYELNVQAAKAELQKAQSKQEQQKQEFKRQKTLHSKGWVAQARLDIAIRSYESAKSDVNYSISKLNLAKRDLKLTTLKAPFNGSIAKKHVDPFTEVKAGQKLFEIDAEGTLEVAFNVPETTISRVILGMTVSIAFPVQKNCVCEGRITEIGSVAGKANAFPVKATLIDPPRTIRPGMTAQVSMAVSGDKQDAAYLIPLAAVAPGKGPYTGYVFVFDPATSKVRRTPIRARGATENMVAISQGIKPGDVIAVAGVSFLTDGQKVKLYTP